ncbi:MAG TPA: site-specific DNA-methyltransferase [Acetobacteraceae bacterium]|jgi:DNA modification methylase
MSNAATQLAGRLFCGHAAEVMGAWPDGCIDLIVTSPPYWTAVAYEGGPAHWPGYDAYLHDMLRVWIECARVLRPNGKLCINAPIMPIPKRVIAQHTRHLKNIAFDMEAAILTATDLARYSMFVWQKQTSKMMFGSYPYPGNIIENNTVEFINVYVKPGRPPRFAPDVKAANKLSRTEWLDLTQQVWFMYPEDVKRGGDHPAPFPQTLPARLMRLYSFGATGDYPGALVLDPFAGTGTTCAVAQSMQRRWIGIDISHAYLDIARHRIDTAAPIAPPLLVGRPRYKTRDELREIAGQEAGTAGQRAEAKHKRRSYGRAAGGEAPALPVA